MVTAITADIRSNPQAHIHSFADRMLCCTHDGVVNIDLVRAHGTVYGVDCDVQEGPCACGGWH